VLPVTSRDLADPMRELPGGRKRILIVDDDEAFRYMIRHVIDKTRFDVIEAGDGEQGIETARQEHPDLIVLDLQMPKRDGFAALQDLRVDPETRLIPVVISTSLAIDDELRSRLPGAASFLPKKDLSQASVSLILQGALQTFVAKP
jgi:CheY-like chemotaxis protein